MDRMRGRLIQVRNAGLEDRARQFLGRRKAERAINVGEMLPVQFIELDAVLGNMLRPIPPAPIAAFGDQQFFVS